MKIQASELKSMLKRINSVKSTQTILTDGGILAMDQDISVCTASVSFAGFRVDTSVDSRKFSSVTNRMSGEIEITTTDSSVILKSSKTKVEIEHKPSPKRSYVKPPKLITLPLGVLKETLKYAASAANPNKAAATGGAILFQSVMGGDLFEEELTGFEAMGTDDNRCAFITADIKPDMAFDYSIPLPAVAALQQMEGETVSFGDAGSVYYFHSGATTVYANKLSKTFPNYKNFVPKDFKFEAELDHIKFKQSLYTVEPMTQEEEKFGIHVHFLDGLLAIGTVGKGGSAEDEIDYAAVKGPGFSSKLNHRFIQDFVSAATQPVVFKANSSTEPILLESGKRKLLVAPVAGGS